MLSFLSPLFLAGVAAAAVPIVLHLLKRQPEARVKFAAVKLLRQAPVEDTQKHRLRELLLLALRVTALLLLAIAFARPFFASGEAAGTASALVVALDTSYSMSAPGRFERAKALARDAIQRAGARELVGVVTFADEAQVVSRPSLDRVLAASAIDRASPGFGATRYRSALSASAQALGGRAGRIVVVSDLQESGWDAGDRASVPAGVSVEIADVGPMPPNLAVTAVRPLGDRTVATIHNASPRPRDVRVHLRIDGRAAGDATVAIGPNQSADATFAGAPRGATAIVSVEDPDGLAADNDRYALLDGPAHGGIVIVGGSGDLSRDAFYVGHALAVTSPGSRPYDVADLSGSALSSIDDNTLSERDAIVVLSTRGLERRGREAIAAFTRRGGGLLVAAGPDVDGDVASDLLGSGTSLRIGQAMSAGARTLAPADGRHPMFRPFAGTAATLGLVRFNTTVRIDGPGCQTLARFTTGDRALLECPAGDGRALVFASDLGNRWNDFPLHASFVPFLHEAVRYLAGGRARTSEYVVGDAPAGMPKQPGVHGIPGGTSGRAPRQAAVNVDPREGDPTRISADEFMSAVTQIKDAGAARGRVEARRQEDDQHLWQYALALMIVALAIEGMIASRTV